jgi:4-hydroxythreonine-4-phosphate dehydrogenase
MTPIFINCGDPNGIGPEVTLKAVALLPDKIRSRVLLAGPVRALAELNGLLGEPLHLEVVQSIRDRGELRSKRGDRLVGVLELEGARDFKPSYGRISSEAGMIAGRGIMWGTAACLAGEASALVTAPVSKEALHSAGFQYPGQTEMIASLAGFHRVIMILTSAALRVGLATTHAALREVSSLLTQDLVLEKIFALNEALTTWFGIAAPKIGVCALNPHASDGGIFGNEEQEVIIPAIDKARVLGIRTEGPFPADALFSRRRNFDGILALYHDQGMIPIKIIALGEAVNFTSGLPFPRTSPDHGTAFDIAGKLIADPRSMERAIRLAYEFSLRRKRGIQTVE